MGKHAAFPLIWAIKARNKPLERVKLMLNAGASTKLTRSTKNVLHAMAKMNRTAKVRLDIIKLLVAHGADLTKKDYHDRTPLGVAILSGSLADIGYLIAAGAQIEIDELQFATDLIDPKKLALLLDHLPDTEDSNQLIASLAPKIRLEIARADSLLDEVKAERGNPTLYEERCASIREMYAMVRAHPGFQPMNEGKVSFDAEPVVFQNLQDATTLLSFNTLLDRVDLTTVPQDTNPLYWAIDAKSDRPERLRLMLAAGAKIPADPGESVLHHFAYTRHQRLTDHAELVRILVDAGEALEALDFQGYTPLASATQHANLATVEGFLQAGANPNAKSRTVAMTDEKRFDAPLLFSAALDIREFKLLLSYGADTTVLSPDGQSLRQYLDARIAEYDSWLAQKNMSKNLTRTVKKFRLNLNKSRALLPA